MQSYATVVQVNNNIVIIIRINGLRIDHINQTNFDEKWKQTNVKIAIYITEPYTHRINRTIVITFEMTFSV